MATLTIVDIPAELVEKLKLKASHHGRSLNSEIVMLLDRMANNEAVDAEAFLARLDRIQKRHTMSPFATGLLGHSKDDLGRR